jgi:putative membrane-bound dehydrogenase-like protein
MRIASRILLFVFYFAALSAIAAAPQTYQLHSFNKLQLSDKFFCEGANFGDFNHDGVMDVVSGPYWYAGPDYTDRHEYYKAAPFDIAGYSKNFFAFTYDVNRDGWTDIIILGFPGEESWWFANPQGKPGDWQRHTIMKVTDNESPALTDITGDGVPEVVCDFGGQGGYAEIPEDDPTQLWQFHPITEKRDFQRFTHGMGVGDVNGDGRKDFLQKEGWWEHPAADSKAETWPFHPVKFSDGGGSQMYAFDIDGDGDNDVVTSKAAHSYGLSWFENLGPDGKEIKFKEHKIMGQKPEENEFGVAFSQLHAVEIADMDHDGVPDIITGKRYWAHAEHDPGSLEPAVLYWFKTDRRKDGVHFVPYQIDMNSGVGTQVTVGDLNGDKWDDIVVGNKKGTFVFTHKVEEVDRRKFEAAQPMPAKPADKPAEKPASPPSAKQEEKSDDDGFAATAADGRALNFDFETGDLTDWTATGTAFQGLPVLGDTVRPRRSDMVSGHHGKYWVGSYERTGDGPQGTLTSVPFKVTHPYATFLIGGGAGGALGVELVRTDTNEVVFHASGRSQEKMRPALADLSKLQGKEIFIRVVDHGSAGWGHVNFDNFRFHDTPPKVAPAFVQNTTGDEYPYAGLPGEEAVRVMKVPDGFKVTLAAAEPDIKQPIAMALDDRGRLWVAEGYEYPVRAAEGKGKDRILIFEDTDGDGKFDKRKVFAEHLNLVSGLEVGFGGVFVGAAPYLLFIPDKDGDDVPDAKPEVLLDGWAYEDTHETLNTFIWGPDGWLYGCHGVFTHSNVGKPGTPKNKRQPITAGIWRYHPTRHQFEVFAEGTSNPWGVDFDDHGQAFCTACVIPHLYHVIQGARYQRQGGPHENEFTYGDIQTIADHRHYAGDNPHGGNGKSGDLGGGHAHCGAMIYLGGAWPDEYRTRILMNNIHGQRINTDILEKQGSGFVGHHGKDFLLSFDLASQILNLRYGPDGQAWVIDWYDTNACHHTNIEGHDRSNGRIYRVSYGNPEHKDVDLKKLTDRELAEMVLEKNDWYVRHSRRILQERAAAGKLEVATRKRLAEIAAGNPDETRRLRAMWALDVTGGVPAELNQKLLTDKNEYVRGWAIQLAIDHDDAHLAELMPQFVSMAKDDASPVVRLYLAAALQRIPPKERWDVLKQLTAHEEDAKDHNLPLMYWYASEPLATLDPERALAFALSCGKTIPIVREFMLRRIGGLENNSGLAILVGGLGKSTNRDEQMEIARGLRSSLSGQRRVKPPKNWTDVYKQVSKNGSPELRSQANAIGVIFGDDAAMDSLRNVASSPDAEVGPRRDALKALLAAKDSKLASTLQSLLADTKLRQDALTGLAQYDDDKTPAKILALYDNLSASEKRAALATLASRTAYGIALIKAVSANEVPAKDLSADLVRQLHNLKDESIDKTIGEVWGQIRNTPIEKAALIAKYRELVINSSPTEADAALGRAVFGRTCQQCHTLYGTGANIGPDLTGSNRSDIEYLLANIVDPSAVIAKDYRATVVATADGRVITGIVSADNDKSITLRTATETIVVPKGEIDERKISEVSMMPDDQLKQFSTFEILSLIAYLRGKEQVSMLATKENAANFFNGKDLTGWKGDASLWRVENGEIIGHSSGLKHNTFLMSDLAARDFKLTLEVKLVDDAGNSGVQFRSESLNGFEEMRGYQADIGPDWWGKLYEENGRALLWDKSGEKFLKKGEWNKYEVEAIGSRIRTWLNGNLCVDLDDPKGKREGVFALQLHAGGPTEVRFRNIKLEVK